MDPNDTNNANIKNSKLLYKDLSYAVVGVLISAHNEPGPYGKEKQYAGAVKKIFKAKGISYIRELRVGDNGNILEMVVEDKIALEFKAKRITTKEDYYQVQRYLQATGLKLALLVNFRDKLIKPKRILRIENWNDSASH
ncbi:MAG TPA: GxxExxY protein [Patescibacteria group bacterium]|nr:GxxExxY protein [Patescibacteria group bacterium]